MRLNDFLFKEEVKRDCIKYSRWVPPHTCQVIHDHKILLSGRKNITQGLLFQIRILISRNNPTRCERILILQKLKVLNLFIPIIRRIILWSILIPYSVTNLFRITSCTFGVDINLVKVNNRLYKVLEIGSHFYYKTRGNHVLVEDNATNHEMIELLHLLKPALMYLSQLNRVQHRVIQIQNQYPPLSLQQTIHKPILLFH